MSERLNGAPPDDGNSEDQHDRIMALHDLIEDSIAYSENIEGKSIFESFNKVDENIRKANELTEGSNLRSNNATEIVLDSELLRRNHVILGKAIENKHLISNQKLVDSIKDVVSHKGSENWDNFTELYLEFATQLNISTSMLNFVNEKPKIKQKASRKTRAKKSLVMEKRPEKSDRLDRQDNSAKEVEYIHTQILELFEKRDNEPIPFFELIIDPHNFMDSVHNALNVSFLTRDRALGITNDAKGMPLVFLPQTDIPPGTETNQAICQLDEVLLKKYAKLYEIKEPLLKRWSGDVDSDTE